MAGIQLFKSSKLSNSNLLGSLQSPTLELSVSPQEPFANPLQSDKASFQFLDPKQSAFFNQINPVRLSLTVPSPLSVKRGLGNETPF